MLLRVGDITPKLPDREEPWGLQGELRMKMPELPGDPGCPVKALPWFRITLGTGGPGALQRPLEGLPHSPHTLL